MAQCLARSQTFSQSARVPFTTILTNLSSGLTSRVHSHAVKVPVTSTTKVSFSDDADVRTNNALSFRHTASSTLQLVVASINDKFSKGSTKSNKAISNHWPNQHKSSCASLLAVCAKCLNSHESGCASLLAAPAKSQSEVQLHVKFIVELVSEGAGNAPTTLQTFAEGDQAAPQNANLQTTNDFRQGATSHFYDDHLRRLIV
jgi:hypothetical protein